MNIEEWIWSTWAWIKAWLGGNSMSLFDVCRIMAEWTTKLMIPMFEFQHGLFPPFSHPAGWIADWLGTDGGLDTLAWFYAANIAFAIGMTNLIIVIHLERKIAARIQDRRGPMLSFRSFRELGEDLAGNSPSWKFKQNYAGIGILQNMADGIKAITKELKNQKLYLFIYFFIIQISG